MLAVCVMTQIPSPAMALERESKSLPFLGFVVGSMISLAVWTAGIGGLLHLTTALEG